MCVWRGAAISWRCHLTDSSANHGVGVGARPVERRAAFARAVLRRYNVLNVVGYQSNGHCNGKGSHRDCRALASSAASTTQNSHSTGYLHYSMNSKQKGITGEHYVTVHKANSIGSIYSALETTFPFDLATLPVLSAPLGIMTSANFFVCKKKCSIVSYTKHPILQLDR